MLHLLLAPPELLPPVAGIILTGLTKHKGLGSLPNKQNVLSLAAVMVFGINPYTIVMV